MAFCSQVLVQESCKPFDGRCEHRSRHGIIELWQVSVLLCANALDAVITANEAASIIKVFISPPCGFDLALTCYREPYAWSAWVGMKIPRG